MPLPAGNRPLTFFTLETADQGTQPIRLGANIGIGKCQHVHIVGQPADRVPKIVSLLACVPSPTGDQQSAGNTRLIIEQSLNDLMGRIIS